MIESFRLKFGSATCIPADTISATPITVFVGPNNSGKSKVLTELSQYCRKGTSLAADVILETASFRALGETESETVIQELICSAPAQKSVRQGYIPHRQVQIPIQSVRQALRNPKANKTQFCEWYLATVTLMLDGKSRIGLVNEQSCGDLQQRAKTSFQKLFHDDVKRAEVRRIVHDAFGTYLVVDPTHPGRLRLRLADAPPPDGLTERGWHKEAVEFHGRALPIEDASDGVKAFTGMISEIVAGDPSIVLIDEPEAFLHPTLSNKLVLCHR